MIIDTGKLIDAIDAAEELSLQKKYGGNWRNCPMSFLDASEKRVLVRKERVREIEDLTLSLLALGVWPTK